MAEIKNARETQISFQEDLETQRSVPVDETIKVLRTAEEIETVREFWASTPGTRDSDIDILLLDQHRNHSDPQRLRVLVLYRDGKPSVLLAGKIVRRPLTFRFGYFPLCKLMANVWTIPYGGLRGEASADTCNKLVREVNRCLKNGEADTALLQYVNAESALFRSACSEPAFRFRDHFTPLRPHRKRKLSGGVGRLFADSSEAIRKFRRPTKKLFDTFAGQVRVDRFEALADLDRTLAVVEEIAKKTWQRKSSTIGFNIKDATLIDLLKTEAEKGHLRIYTLYLGGTPCAFWIGAVYHGTFFSDFLGYDPDYARYSPGIFLLSQLFEECSSEGVEEVDFGFSDEEYKQRFSNVTWQDATVHIFAPTLRGLTLSTLKMITVLPHEVARAALKRTNLYQKAKIVWRKMAGRNK